MPPAQPALLTLLIVRWLVITGMMVGRARTKYKLRPPAAMGDPGFGCAVIRVTAPTGVVRAPGPA